MNWFIMLAGLFAGFTVIGHFTMGSKLYLKPMLVSDMNEIPRKIMHCVFHYISVYLVLSCLVLLTAGFGIKSVTIPPVLLQFIALNYIGFALVQILIALTSKINNVIFKMFQWTFFVLIAVLTLLGI